MLRSGVSLFPFPPQPVLTARMTVATSQLARKKTRDFLVISEAVFQPLPVFALAGGSGYPGGILGLGIGKTSPGSVIFAENNGPFSLGRNHMQAVGTGRKGFAFNGHLITEGNGGIVIRAGAPNLIVGHQSPPDVPFLHSRAVVGDGDVGEPDFLGDAGKLAWPGKG